MSSLWDLGTGEIPNFLKVLPTSIHLKCELHREEVFEFAITNTCNTAITWAISNDWDERFHLNPNQSDGILEANQSEKFTVTMQEFDQIPADSEELRTWIKVYGDKIDPETTDVDNVNSTQLV